MVLQLKDCLLCTSTQHKTTTCKQPTYPHEEEQSATVRGQYLSGFLLHCWMVFMVNIDGVIRLMVCEVESVSEAVSFEDAAIYFLQQYSY